MARAKNNGNGRLDDMKVLRNQSIANLNQSAAALNQSTAALNQSMATLNLAMASFVAQNVDTNTRLTKLEAEASERFARIEAILMEHSRILRALPEVIRDKIGLKVLEQSSSE
jgi:septal ring factor EnvC (AmiA/AmiB activator)